LYRFALLLLSIPLLAHGGDGISQAVRNRQMTTVTCPQFMLVPPKARWLRVTGCEIDYTRPAITAAGSQVTEMYFAMRTRDEPGSAPVSLIVATRDPRALAVAQQALGNGTPVDDEAFTIAMLRVVDILGAAREVDGYARGGIIGRMITRRALAGFGTPLSSELVVLDLHARPSFLIPGMEAGAGVALLIAAAALRRRRPAVAVAERGPAESETALAPAETVEGTVEHPEPPLDIAESWTEMAQPLAEINPPPAAAASESAAQPEPPAPPEPPPQILERRLPPAMLLNLDPSASVTEIEYAPPLGNAQEVAERIAGVLGPLTAAGDGRYSVSGSDWRLDFDLGRDDSVWTASVDARGSEAALDALDRVVRETSWRVFVPRLGAFR
jgi:hypothetical protein